MPETVTMKSIREFALRNKDKISDHLQTRYAYRRLFETDDGKLVLRHLMKVGFVTRSTFVAGDPHRTALNEGARRLVLSIIRAARINVDKLIDDIGKELADEI